MHFTDININMGNECCIENQAENLKFPAHIIVHQETEREFVKRIGKLQTTAVLEKAPLLRESNMSGVSGESYSEQQSQSLAQSNDQFSSQSISLISLNSSAQSPTAFQFAQRKVAKKEFQDGFYEGEMKAGVPDGLGVYHWTNGNQCHGEWKNGQLNGRGIAYYRNGDKYDGEWSDGKMHGKGIYYHADGSKFEGEVKDGLLHGMGSVTYKNGDQYVGPFKNSKRHGEGWELIKGKKYKVKYDMEKRVAKDLI